MNPIVRSIMLEELQEGTLIHQSPHYDVITSHGKTQYTPNGLYGAVMIRLYPEIYRYAQAVRMRTYDEFRYFKIGGQDNLFCIEREIRKPAWKYLFGEPYIIQNERIKHDLRVMPPMGDVKIRGIIGGDVK